MKMGEGAEGVLFGGGEDELFPCRHDVIQP